ncbi:MAG: hypothetical protein ACI4OJ_09945 [Lachnospiraceae bacterium]
MSRQADEKILALVKPEYLEKIPAFVRGHATGNTCRLIEREHPELYAQFEEAAPSEAAKDQMAKVINDIFAERMKKHHML